MPEAPPRVSADDVRYAALCARDPRFDGRFWVGVTTTGIYCRPICPARTPRRDRVRFFDRPSAAESAGFRACKRCLPRSRRGTPNDPSPGAAEGATGEVAEVDLRAHLARAAVRRIERGALAGGRRVDHLAAELGVGERQLRRVVRAELGASLTELARSARLRLATELLTGSDLSVTEIAFASGYGSLRRLNAEFLERKGRAPRELRRGGRPSPDESFVLRIAYRRPFAWESSLGWLRRHALAGAEFVDGTGYARTVRLGDHVGWLRVRNEARSSRLVVECAPSLVPVVGELADRVRRLFDVDTRADVVDRHLARDGEFAADVAADPGVRLPGSFEAFEPAWRAVVGQQVSVAAANTVGARLCARFGEPLETPIPDLWQLTPRAERLAQVSSEELQALGLTRARATTLCTLAKAVTQDPALLRDGPASSARRLALPGIGPWTASWIELRSFSNPDAFPAGDLALRRALGVDSDAELLSRAEAWRPWRAYAAVRLWNRAVAEKPVRPSALRSTRGSSQPR